MIAVFATIPGPINNQSLYELKIEDQTYQISYQVDAEVLLMTIDTESNSLLIGLENTRDSELIISLEQKLINAEDNNFVILVDNIEVDYDITSNSNNSIVTFFVPDDTEEVEIIGTNVVPEFPVGAIIGLSMMILVVTIIAKAKTSFFKW
jgi:hypothetical protein